VRILIATDVPRKREAGTAAVLLNHAAELRKLGHDVETWFLEDVVDPDAWPKRLVALTFAVRVAKRILKAPKKYDVVDLHAPAGCVYGIWRRVLGSEGTPPYVFTMQGILERYAHTMRREHLKARAWHFGWKNRLWHRVYHRTMYGWAIRTADYGVASNREAWTYPELRYDRDYGRLWYVPNGTEESYFINREYHEKPVIKLLFVGTWLDRKGVYYLADAFRLVTQQKREVELTVAGSFCPGDEVRRFFAPEIRGRVNVIPFVKREDMSALYADHDIFVFPSLMEGMPLALLEAMATGMPAVTTETCGMADVVEDGFTGFLVPPANTVRLAEAIEQLCESVELRKRMGQEAQQTMRRYTWARVTQKLEMVLSLAVQQAAKH
jgi:glycosyltransferase involved in cell wall biosynthesis